MYAGFKIDANRIGNKQGANTIVSVGVVGDEEEKTEEVQAVIDETFATLPSIAEKEEKLQNIKDKSDDIKHRLQSVRRELVREMIRQAFATNTLANIRKQMADDKVTRYIMAKTMFNGVIAYIDTKQYPVTFDQSDIILKSGDEGPNEEAYFR